MARIYEQQLNDIIIIITTTTETTRHKEIIKLHFASYLKELKYFEESFAAYEKGVDLFTFSSNATAALNLWTDYLQNFIIRYKGTQMARTRELYDRCY